MKIAVMGVQRCGESPHWLRNWAGSMTALFCIWTGYNLSPDGKRETGKKQTYGREFLNENQDTGWIIDGNYAKFCQERRLEEADLIVFMDYTRRICLWQAVKRYLEYRV